MGKTLITGTGRSGTSFLIELYTRLGFNTGYTVDECYVEMHRHKDLHGGIEHGIDSDRTKDAGIIKNPNFFYDYDVFDKYKIDHVVLCVRQIDAASASRSYQIENPTHNYGGFCGGATTEEEQTEVNTRAMYNFIEMLSQRNIEVTLVNFPKMITDPLHLFQNLFKYSCVDLDDFMKHHGELADPDKVRF